LRPPPTASKAAEPLRQVAQNAAGPANRFKALPDGGRRAGPCFAGTTDAFSPVLLQADGGRVNSFGPSAKEKGKFTKPLTNDTIFFLLADRSHDPSKEERKP
jgi:hypothetical protein